MTFPPRVEILIRDILHHHKHPWTGVENLCCCDAQPSVNPTDKRNTGAVTSSLFPKEKMKRCSLYIQSRSNGSVGSVKAIIVNYLSIIDFVSVLLTTRLLSDHCKSRCGQGHKPQEPKYFRMSNWGILVIKNPTKAQKWESALKVHYVRFKLMLRVKQIATERHHIVC